MVKIVYKKQAMEYKFLKRYKEYSFIAIGFWPRVIVIINEWNTNKYVKKYYGTWDSKSQFMNDIRNQGVFYMKDVEKIHYRIEDDKLWRMMIR